MQSVTLIEADRRRKAGTLACPSLDPLERGIGRGPAQLPPIVSGVVSIELSKVTDTGTISIE
jgi:hypothetical protein